jgi:hypothetical membrane protein
MGIDIHIKNHMGRNSGAGALLFISAIQYFFVQIIVALRFSPPYSITYNTISDLGNTDCGIYHIRAVCSPLYPFMNVSFIALGCATFFGTLLLRRQYKGSRSICVGYNLFAAGGIGTILVGLFPENTNIVLHGLSAALPFLLGNIGVVVLGASLTLSRPLRLYTLATGVIALVALAMYALMHFSGAIGGGIERIVAYPQTLWMIIMGTYYLREERQINRSRSRPAIP